MISNSNRNSKQPLLKGEIVNAQRISNTLSEKNGKLRKSAGSRQQAATQDSVSLKFIK